MTYLDLVNAVLVRLREDTITDAQLDSDPYYRVIGSHVNDAKDRVEDAWQWSQLRTTDFFIRDPNDNDPANQEYERVQPGQVNLTLPDSADNHYLLKRIFVRDTGGFLRLYSIPQMRQRYAGVYINSTPTGTINAYSFADVDANNNQRITLYPVPDKEFNVEIDVVRHQDQLVAATDVLKVPSLPVYSLATALASRERGEVGGTPTSELFTIADSHLSDAIAIDSARFVEEMDWFSEQNDWHNTNVRTA